MFRKGIEERKMGAPHREKEERWYGAVRTFGLVVKRKIYTKEDTETNEQTDTYACLMRGGGRPDCGLEVGVVEQKSVEKRNLVTRRKQEEAERETVLDLNTYKEQLRTQHVTRTPAARYPRSRGEERFCKRFVTRARTAHS